MLANLFYSFGWTRDDAKWVWAQAVAGASFVLAGLFDVHQWVLDYIGYDMSVRQVRWFVLICGVIAWLAARNGNSALPGAPKNGSSGGFRPPAAALLLPLLLLGGVVLVTPACASNGGAVHVVTAADTALVNALHQALLDEETAYQSGLLSTEQRDHVLKTLRQVDRDALALTDAIDAWRAGGGNPQTVPKIVNAARVALTQIVADLGPGLAGSGLVKSINAVLVLLS